MEEVFDCYHGNEEEYKMLHVADLVTYYCLEELRSGIYMKMKTSSVILPVSDLSEYSIILDGFSAWICCCQTTDLTKPTANILMLLKTVLNAN